MPRACRGAAAVIDTTDPQPVGDALDGVQPSAPLEAPAPPNPTPDVEATRAFLRLLWQDGPPPGTWITTWSKAGGSRQFRDVDSAAQFLCEQPDRYLGCAAMQGMAQGKRGGKSDARASAGLAIDIDFVGGAHKETRLPTEAQAFALLEEAGVAVSLVVRSGGGLYAWVLFDEPFIIRADAERRRWEALSNAWHTQILSAAAGHDWVLDSTSDLTRCLRAPGTLNCKYSPPRRVELVRPVAGEEVQRFSFEALEQQLVAPAAAAKRSKAPESSPKASRPAAAGCTDWLQHAGSLLGGVEKTFEIKGKLGGIVLHTCPVCRGLEAGGTTAHGTAHLVRQTGTLACKRASCEAVGGEGIGGFGLETWTGRFLEPPQIAELIALRSQDPLAFCSFTDDGNARRIVQRYGTDLRWCPVGEWHYWNGKRWVPSEALAVRLARKTANLIGQEAKGANDVATAQAIEKHQKKSLSVERIRAMLRLASSDLFVQASDLDADPWLLNVENGTLDLRTDKLRPHERRDLCTKIAGARYRPDAHSDDVDKFLNSVTRGDLELLDQLERLMGCTLVGEKRDDVVVLLIGPGSTGKTTLLEAMAAMLGDYSQTVSFDALVAAQRASNGPTPEVAKLRGARFVKASEAPDGGKLNAALIKSMAGGDGITARGLYEGPGTFKCGFMLWMAANVAPRLSSSDSGMRRRMVFLPFEHVLAGEAVDRDLRTRLQGQAAREALLARAVRGARRWLNEGGLTMSAAAANAAAKYWAGGQLTDIVDEFIAAECVLDPGAWTSSEALMQAARVYAAQVHAEAPNPKQLAQGLRKHGGTEAPTQMKRGWRGIRLLPPDDRPGDSAPSADGPEPVPDGKDGKTADCSSFLEKDEITEKTIGCRHPVFAVIDASEGGAEGAPGTPGRGGPTADDRAQAATCINVDHHDPDCGGPHACRWPQICFDPDGRAVEARPALLEVARAPGVDTAHGGSHSGGNAQRQPDLIEGALRSDEEGGRG